jgi:hypothetical protein
MNGLAKLALGALMIGSAAVAVTPASAGAAVGTGDGSHAKPCRFYVHRDLPAPHRCYRFFRNVYGPEVYLRDGYVFRDREASLRFEERGGVRHRERLAEREDYRNHEEAARDRSEMRHDEERERYADREEAARDQGEMRHDEDRRYAERDEASGGASRDGSTVHEGSGGASRGDHVHEGSGGASQGAHVRESSGGASRGNEVNQGRSGGASSH